MKKALLGFVVGLAIGIGIMSVYAVSSTPDLKNPSLNRIGYSYTYAITQPKPVLVLFYTDWCTACQNFFPIYKLLHEIFGNAYNFAMINCDDKYNQRFVDAYSIQFFPSLYIVDDKGKTRTFVDLEKCNTVEGLKVYLDDYLKNKSK